MVGRRSSVSNSAGPRCVSRQATPPAKAWAYSSIPSITKCVPSPDPQTYFRKQYQLTYHQARLVCSNYCGTWLGTSDIKA